MEKQKGTVGAVDKAFALLETMLAYKEPVTIKELSADTKIPKSTIHGLLSTMRLRGIVEQNQNGEYIPGYRLLEYGFAAYMSWDDVQLANPILYEISKKTKANSLLAVDTYGAVVNVGYWCPKETVAGVIPYIGKKYPFHATAMGKVFLADYDEKKAELCLKRDGLKKYTSNTITDIESIKNELKIIKTTGFAVCNGEFHEVNKGIAVPVYDRNKKMIYALGALDDITGMDEEKVREIVGVLKNGAKKLSRLLG